MKTSKKLFFLLLLIIPLNLGKHFELVDSYVWGVLSDYLVPVVYLQDILVALIIFFWLIEKKSLHLSDFKKFLNKDSVPSSFLLIFSLLFSVLGSSRMLPSFFVFLRITLYVFLYFYVMSEISFEKDYPMIVKTVSVNVLFLGLLGAAQFLKQGSFFNNYLVLGEQPYSSATWNVAKENVFGGAKIPSYGLFRHPNIFGGYLSIVLIWIFSRMLSVNKNGAKEGRGSKFLYVAAFLLGLASLVLTFSYVAWAAFILGISSCVYILYFKKYGFLIKKQNVAVLFLLLFLIINSLSPFFENIRDTSFSRRGGLVREALLLVEKNSLFGVGPGAFSANSSNFAFLQPVHNIFLLIFSEGGVFSLLFFMNIFINVFFRQLRSTENTYSPFLLTALLQILLIGSLDHYFWTIHQTQLLYWTILGFSFSKGFERG